MKSKLLWVITFSFVCLFTDAAFAAQPFDAAAYGLEGNYVLHRTLFGELNEGQGDTEIRLIGEQPAGSGFNKRLFLEIVPPKGRGEIYLIPLQDTINGFEPQIQLHSFTDPEKKEIFLSVSGADRSFQNNFYIIQIGGYDDSRFIYDSAAVNMPVAKGNFRAGFKLRMLVLDTNQESFIDLSPRKSLYSRSGIYNAQNGALRREMTAWSGQFVALEPTDTDGDGIAELRGLMIMYGVGSNDPLAQIQSVLKYRRGGWYVERVDSAPASGLNYVRSAPAPKTQPSKKPTGRIVRVKRATPAATKRNIDTTPAP